MSPRDAHAILRTDALALPGVARVSASRGWSQKKKGRSRYHGLRVWSFKVWRRTWGLAEAWAWMRYGESPIEDLPLPSQIPTEEWEEMFTQCLEQAHHESKRP